MHVCLQEKRLAGQVAVVTEEIDRIKSEGEGAELQKCEDQLKKVKLENERLAVDLDKAKKVRLLCSIQSTFHITLIEGWLIPIYLYF